MADRDAPDDLGVGDGLAEGGVPVSFLWEHHGNEIRFTFVVPDEEGDRG